jgi:hypothetical protein
MDDNTVTVVSVADDVQYAGYHTLYSSRTFQSNQVIEH